MNAGIPRDLENSRTGSNTVKFNGCGTRKWQMWNALRAATRHIALRNPHYLELLSRSVSSVFFESLTTLIQNVGPLKTWFAEHYPNLTFMQSA